jgi:hypothetical protein
MNTWDTASLWQFFESQGVDVRTMTAYPLHGPLPAEPPPAPGVGEDEAAELSRRVFQAQETLKRVQQTVRHWHQGGRHVRHR